MRFITWERKGNFNGGLPGLYLTMTYVTMVKKSVSFIIVESYVFREEEQMRDKELQRKHEREMMDKQIKMADNLRYVTSHILPPCVITLAAMLELDI